MRLLLLIVGSAWLVQVLNKEIIYINQINLAKSRQASMMRHHKTHMPISVPLDPQALQQQIGQANEILQELALPWDGLFQTLETTQDKDIALLLIEPNAVKQRVHISGEAKSLVALLVYIERLNKSNILNHVYLTSHEIRTDDTEQPVRFTLIANWTVN